MNQAALRLYVDSLFTSPYAMSVFVTLREKGLLFVGLDVIGEHLTEINVTSPTCIREIDNAFGTDIGGMLMDAIDQKLKAR